MRDAAVQDVADDRDGSPAKLSELFHERIDIEQCLRRMRVHAIARVDDVSVECHRHALRKSGLVMSNHQHANAERAERKRGVFERFPFRREAQAFGTRLTTLAPSRSSAK